MREVYIVEVTHWTTPVRKIIVCATPALAEYVAAQEADALMNEVGFASASTLSGWWKTFDISRLAENKKYFGAYIFVSRVQMVEE